MMQMVKDRDATHDFFTRVLGFIEIMGMSGFDYSDRCRAPNLGTLAVRFEVEAAAEARDRITGTGLGDTKRDQPRAAGTLWGHRPVRRGDARRRHHSVLLDREITPAAASRGLSSSRRASSRSPAIIPR